MHGACSTGHHAGKEGGCTGSYEVFYFDVRGTKSTLVKTGEVRYCDCSCHGTTKTEKPKKKTRAPRRKK